MLAIDEEQKKIIGGPEFLRECLSEHYHSISDFSENREPNGLIETPPRSVFVYCSVVIGYLSIFIAEKMATADTIAIIAQCLSKKVRLDLSPLCTKEDLLSAIKTHFPELNGCELRVTYFDKELSMELEVSTNTSLFHKAVVTIHKTKQGNAYDRCKISI